MSSAGNARPLTGVRVLVGRARHQARQLSEGLKARGAEVIEIPLIEIRKPKSYQPFDTALRQIADYDWLILTSVNGAQALAERMKCLHIAAKALEHLQIAAIGPATRDAIKKLELRVAVVPARYVAESVVDALRDQVKGKRMLLARARIARDVIPRELAKLGAQLTVVDAYETVVPESSRTRLRGLISDRHLRPQVIAFTSSSTVRNFVELVGGPELNGRALAGIHLASIGPVTSGTLRAFGLPVSIEAREYTIAGLIEAIGSAMQRPRQPL
jgi:uroporphyrinogen-III synthase